MPLTGTDVAPGLPARTETGLSRAAGMASLLVLLLAAVVLIPGWGLGLDLFVRLRAGLPAMVPSTASGLGAVALAQLLQMAAPRIARRAGSLLAALTTAWALAASLRIVAAYSAAAPAPGDRMALATALGLFLAAAATLAAGLPRPRAPRIAAAIATAGTLLALVGLDGYVIDIEAIFGSILLTGMSPLTAVGLLLLFGSVLMSTARHSWVAIVAGEGRGSRAARRILPLAVLLPFVLSLLSLGISNSGILHPHILLSALSVLVLLAGAFAVLRAAAYANVREAMTGAVLARMRSALDGLDAAVFLFGRDGTLQLANGGAEALCAGAASCEDWLFSARFHSLGDRRVLGPDETPARALFAEEAPADRFVGWIDPEGNEHALRFCLHRQPDTGIAVLSVFDETQGWILRENISRSERLDAVAQMSGGIAHEMANVLGVVQLSADTALKTGDAARALTRMEAIRAASRRGSAMIDRLLGLARTPGDETGVSDLALLLPEVAALARQVLPANIRLELAACDGPVPVRVPESEMQAAVLNLVLNARNAISETRSTGGHIALALEDGPDVTLRVADDGPGMSEAVLRRARDPFFTTRLNDGGTGLGLAMVDSLARRAGGRLELTSTPGEGTVILLSLPAAAGETGEARGAPNLPDLAGLSVLVVEDDPQFMDSIADALRLSGAAVALAVSAEEALAGLSARPAPDLLLTDIVLPGHIDGYHLALLACERHPGLKVIYLSGYAAPTTEAGRSVPGLLLRKPVRLAELLNAVILSLGAGPRP
ncbi:ATP-binding protein [Salipiger sp. H15]|uniref:histidine kinase n=1 Tax=Alloyangia sp. H15 TaxID=3029062 RepID=A0AAU8AHK9_9RHOB